MDGGETVTSGSDAVIMAAGFSDIAECRFVCERSFDRVDPEGCRTNYYNRTRQGWCGEEEGRSQP